MTRGNLDAGLAAGLKTIVLFYRLLISPVLGASCRFHPSCSRYALDAIEMHGGRRGGWLTLRRLARCHPWGGAGHDPVPDLSHLAERTR